MAATQRNEFSNVIHADFGRTRAGAIQQRLRRATERMAQEVRIQQREVGNFRSEIKKLDTEIKSLARSLVAFRDSMQRINVVPLRRRALRLARIMETAESAR